MQLPPRLLVLVEVVEVVLMAVVLLPSLDTDELKGRPGNTSVADRSTERDNNTVNANAKANAKARSSDDDEDGGSADEAKDDSPRKGDADNTLLIEEEVVEVVFRKCIFLVR
mmetsp:Transcript_27939/g.38793  ORF Transcript_27939/g.38793 Transcript_27939/m.38793 type:complete len:112 (+) Transcript_27939:201-536(+)